jgi:hypothetical protein
MKYILLIIFSVSMMACQAKDNGKKMTISTSYPLSTETPTIVVSNLDQGKKRLVLAGLSHLKVGDSSKEVVEKLGYKPDAYYISPDKSPNARPKALIMEYCFERYRKPNDPLVIVDQSLYFVFSTDDKLKSMTYALPSGEVPKVSIPVF